MPHTNAHISSSAPECPADPLQTNTRWKKEKGADFPLWKIWLKLYKQYSVSLPPSPSIHLALRYNHLYGGQKISKLIARNLRAWACTWHLNYECHTFVPMTELAKQCASNSQVTGSSQNTRKNAKITRTVRRFGRLCINVNAWLTQNIKLKIKRRYFTHFIPPSTFPILSVKRELFQKQSSREGVKMLCFTSCVLSTSALVAPDNFYRFSVPPIWIMCQGLLEGGLGWATIHPRTVAAFIDCANRAKTFKRLFCWRTSELEQINK